LIASCVFYCAFIPAYIFILFFTILIDYFAGILIENAAGRKRKGLLVLSLVSNIGVLAVFKYYNFFIENVDMLLQASHLSVRPLPLLHIILPIGLSFHTFQAMSYTIEVYRGNQRPERHFGIYALYVLFYPQLVAGPIERPQNLLHQFHERHDPDPGMIGSGLRLMAWGYFKKMVVADHLAMYVDKVFGPPIRFAGIPTLIAVLFFSFQIYCDFSAYSDIARGAARVMGIRLMRNFNFPYFSRSIREFWGRWHISLSTWFRDYLYIPLGGNRTGMLRWCFNIMVVFLLSGIWHGANWTFVIWGALHGLYLIAGHFAGRWTYRAPVLRHLRLPGFFHTFVVFMLVTFGWILFRSPGIAPAVEIMRNCLDIKGFDWHYPDFTSYIITKVNFAICVAGLLAMVTIETLTFRFNAYQRFLQWNGTVRLICYILLCAVIVVVGVFNNNKFIYFQF
jgi:D-alanyl-lipoteichoic acid acyltransferase DltB (MBOAT superfamily)